MNPIPENESAERRLPESPVDRKNRWRDKFPNAFRGALTAFRTQNSFWIHLPLAVLVMIVAVILQATLLECAILLLCIGGVLVAELLNTGLELIAKVVTDREDERIRLALDTGAGAVLIASLIALVVGALILGNRLLVFLELV